MLYTYGAVMEENVKTLETADELFELFSSWAEDHGLIVQKSASYKGPCISVYVFNECIGTLFTSGYKYEFAFTDLAWRVAMDKGNHHPNGQVIDGNLYNPVPMDAVFDGINEIMNYVNGRRTLAEGIKDCLCGAGYTCEISSCSLFDQDLEIVVRVQWLGHPLGHLKMERGGAFESSEWRSARHGRFRDVCYVAPTSKLALSDKLTDVTKRELLNFFCARAWNVMYDAPASDRGLRCPGCDAELEIDANNQLVFNGDDDA
jgi:hypothetical protein